MNAKIKNQINDLAEVLAKKANKDLVKSLHERVENLTSIEHINFLKDDLLPQVN